MLTKFHKAGLLWPTVFSVVGVALLLALGQWQLQRKAWKEALIAQIETGAHAEPVALGALPPVQDFREVEFRRVRLAGRFWHNGELHVWTPGPRGSAWMIATPFELTEPPARIVLVMRGVVEDVRKDAGMRKEGQVEGEIDLIGRIRLDQPSTFVSPPKPGENVWLSRDLKAMTREVMRALKAGSSRGETQNASPEVLPFFVEAESQIGGPQAPVPRFDALTLTNRHLEYALTWFGLAATLGAVFAAFMVSRLKAAA